MLTPRLLDQVRTVVRVKHFSLSTERAYVSWIRRFILFHHKRHPKHMAEPEIRRLASQVLAKLQLLSFTPWLQPGGLTLTGGRRKPFKR
jgi:hypothetical protein